ncbi:MAG: DAK2 domain-containing protein [Dehalococcoidales bacterium]|nr:DAK2 domain-containing protein [Dehalococcoidales bacterium]
MEKVASLSGQRLRDMIMVASDWLEKNAADIDSLNVFPVPDGDTGTNMLLTMRSTLEEAYRAPDHSTSAVAQAIARGALMGARGNSGVILSQIWHGLALGLEGKESCSGRELAEALLVAATEAYKGIDNPVEGTILTVIKDASAAAKAKADSGCDDLTMIMETTVSAARESVANTPNLLAVLREAGVVDAGGQGLYTILEGILHYLRGETEEIQQARPGIIISNTPVAARTSQMIAADEVPYGYCTEFIIKGQELDPDKLRAKLKKKGESLIVVGDKTAVKVHIHTTNPGSIVRMATALGTLHQVSIRNMDEQYQDFLEMQKEKMPPADIATVAVVSGDGLSDVFSSLGVAAVVPGGRTMNPSTKDLLQAVNSVASDKVIILPNNKNVIPAARKVRSVTDKTVKVIATQSIPQGIAAVLAFNSEADLEANIQAMKKTIATVRSIAVTRAARSSQVGNLEIAKKQPIGFLDGELVTTGDSVVDALGKTLAKVDLSAAEVVTIYYQGSTERSEVEEFNTGLRQQYPHLQIELVKGGQPHYNYIASVE